eukprot:11189832-Lingulodinium_polyedra.AAC.1
MKNSTDAKGNRKCEGENKNQGVHMAVGVRYPREHRAHALITEWWLKWSADLSRSPSTSGPGH